MNRRKSWNINMVFLLLIFGFALAGMLKPDRAFSEKENRSLSAMPKLTAESLVSGEFEQDYEDYLTDQFLFRDGWIGLKTKAMQLLGQQDVNDVYFASDGYLIEKHTGTFTADRAAQNRQLLIGFSRSFVQNYPDIRLQVMIVPNAVDILRDRLPAFAAPYDEEVYLGELSRSLPAGVWAQTAEVLGAHADEEIFYRTDHHWTSRGAFLVYRDWIAGQGFEPEREDRFHIRAVSSSFTGTVAAKVGMEAVPDTIELYERKELLPVRVSYPLTGETRDTLYSEKALETHDQYAFFLGGNFGRTDISTRAGTGRRLLLVKDSYAHCFVPFLVAHYDEIDMIDLRYYNQSLKAALEEGAYTDLLILYNAAGFAEDTALGKLLL